MSWAGLGELRRERRWSFGTSRCRAGWADRGSVAKTAVIILDALPPIFIHSLVSGQEDRCVAKRLRIEGHDNMPGFRIELDDIERHDPAIVAEMRHAAKADDAEKDRAAALVEHDIHDLAHRAATCTSHGFIHAWGKFRRQFAGSPDCV